MKTTKTTKFVVFCYKNELEMVKMKGPNPFAPWEEKPGNIYGRRMPIRIFNAFANATTSKQGRLMMVYGGPGMGKTFLMRHFVELAGKNGLLAPYIKLEKGESTKELVRRMHRELTQFPGFRGTKKPDDFKDLVDMAERFGRFGAAFFIDDMDNMRKADKAVKEIAALMKMVWGKRRVSFVISSTKEFKVESETVDIIRLEPLDEHDARELVSKALGNGPPKMGEECLHSIMADSNGNPRIFKTICRHIYDRLRDDEKVISKGHYLAYLSHIMSMFSNEWFGRMYQETPESEREILRVLAKHEKGVHVSDVAEKLGKKLGPVTALVGRLLDRGHIVRIGRGKYRIFARLYAKYIIQRS